MPNRDDFLQLDDTALLAHCRTDVFKGSGNGGQKRNKCSTAVRLVCTELGVEASDCSERSQMMNRRNALKKLRMNIALQCRSSELIRPSRMDVSISNPEYFLWAARVADAVAAYGGLAGAGDFLGVSASKLEKLLRRDPALWQYILKIIRNRLEKNEKQPIL